MVRKLFNNNNNTRQKNSKMTRFEIRRHLLSSILLVLSTYANCFFFFFFNCFFFFFFVCLFTSAHNQSCIVTWKQNLLVSVLWVVMLYLFFPLLYFCFFRPFLLIRFSILLRPCIISASAPLPPPPTFLHLLSFLRRQEGLTGISRAGWGDRLTGLWRGRTGAVRTKPTRVR